jgi:membrane protease YdiL (CAAX protease family)
MFRKIFHNGREVRAGWRLVMFLILFVVVGRVVRKGLERLPLPSDSAFLHPVDLIVAEGGTLVVALIATAIMARFERRRLTVYGVPRIGDLFGQLFWTGAVWGLIMPSAIIFLIFLSGGYRVLGLNLAGWDLFKFACLWLLANLLIGFSEEVTFRGYFLYTLADGIGFWAAALISAVGFGALHYFLKPHERWEDWVAVSLLTIFITLALRRTGSLAFAIGMHAAFDFMFLYVFSGMNGGVFAFGRLLSANFPGSVRVTGGLLGPEASWFCFLVTAAAIVLLHFAYREAKWPVPAEDSKQK